MQYQLDRYQGHIRSLDGLRGLAIILVLLYHLFPYIRLTQVGWAGVDLFFVLSGFLITGILLDTVEHKHYWKNFFGRRVLRIFPLYYFTLILFVALAALLPWFASHEFVNYEYFEKNQLWFWSYLMNWKILQEGFWLPVEVFNIFWSLAIEEQFYLFWPFVVLFFRKRLLWFIVPAILVVIASRFYLVFGDVWTNASVYTNTLTRIDTLLSGALLATLIRSEKWRAFLEKHVFKLILGVLFLSGLMFALIIRGFHPFNPFVMTYGYTLVYLLFGGLLITVVHRGPALAFVRKIFENKVMVFFGKYSYALYVFHWAAYKLLNDELVKHFAVIFKKEILAMLVSSILILLFVVLISQITWHLFEKRFLNLKGRFSYSRDR